PRRAPGRHQQQRHRKQHALHGPQYPPVGCPAAAAGWIGGPFVGGVVVCGRRVRRSFSPASSPMLVAPTPSPSSAPTTPNAPRPPRLPPRKASSASMLPSWMSHSCSPGQAGASGPRTAPLQGGLFDTTPCDVRYTRNFIAPSSVVGGPAA